MGDLILPQPTKSARYVYEVTGAILESIPGFGILKKFADIHLNRRIEEALRQIVAEVQESGIDVLTETQFEFYLPSAYRFAEQVRLGDYEHNLKILRKILVDGLKTNSTDSGKIGRHARQLEYLSEFEVAVLAAVHKYLDFVDDADTPRNWAGLEELKLNGFMDEAISDVSIATALSVLNGRGLLIPNGNPTIDRVAGTYRLSEDGDCIVLAALEKAN
jgi:hypothetical protein